MIRFMLFLAVLVTYTTISFGADASSKPVIKIGVVVAISGNNSSLGENARNALLMRLSQLQPTCKYDYKLIFEDDEFVYSKTALAIQKFKNIDRVDAIFDLWGYSSDIAIPILKGTQIINFSADRWNEPAPIPNDFSAGCPVRSYVVPTVDVMKKLGIRKVGLFTFGEKGTINCAEELKKQMKEAGIMVTQEMMATDQRDFRTWILKLKESNPDMLIAMSVMPTQEILLRQMKEMGYDLPFCCVGAGLWDVNPIYTKGAWFIDPSPAKEEFKISFRAAYGRDYRYPATQVYDVLTAFITACEKGDGKGKPTCSQICQALKEIRELQGATGTINFEPPNRLTTPLSYYMMTDKSAKVVSPDEIAKTFGKRLRK